MKQLLSALAVAIPLALSVSVVARQDNSDKIAEAQRKLAEQCRAQPERCRDGPVTDPTEWKEYMTLLGNGSGFVVNTNGYIITNHHVVKKCNAVTVSAKGITRRSATLQAVDRQSDLALLKLPATYSEAASFREARRAILGEPIMVAGFPLRGTLSAGLNVSTGTVSALAGAKGDPTRLQVSAPIQPGNSGGPLLDGGATVIGVVVSRLGELYTFDKYGSLPQNINFAVKGVLVRGLLDIHGIDYEIVRRPKHLGDSEVAAIAEKITVLVECWK